MYMIIIGSNINMIIFEISIKVTPDRAYAYFKNQTGDEPQRQDTQANKGTPPLRGEVPY